MSPVAFTREQSRRVDQIAVEEFGFSGLVLMENAGRGVADVLCRLGIAGPVVICCGRGNNAGDGFVIARHLDLRGHQVRVLLWSKPEELTGDAAANYHILAKTDVPIEVFGGEHDEARLSRAVGGGGMDRRWAAGHGRRGEPRPPLDSRDRPTQRRRRAEVGDRPAQRAGLRHRPARPGTRSAPPRPARSSRRRPVSSRPRPRRTSAAFTFSTSARRGRSSSR